MLSNTLQNKFIKLFEKIEYGSLSLTIPDGKIFDFKGTLEGPHATLHIKDWRALSSYATKGHIGLAESYRDGYWDSNDLPTLLYVGLKNQNSLGANIHGSALSQLISRIQYMFRQNTLKGSKRNIHAHYDIGNDFYELWLDPTMTYSSALYKNGNETLEQAQYNKYDRILSRLEKPSGRILEVGCGWGGFAQRALSKNDIDFDLKGITLSEEQQRYAQARLGQNANIVLEDYRHQKGKFDYLVSIEMFEAVGEKFWPTYFGKMKSLLQDKGKAVVQTITIQDRLFDAYRKRGDMFRTFIFPGGMLPSPSRFKEEAQKADLRVSDEFSFGQDYSKTCAEWLKTFDAKQKEILALGYDQSFIRIWRIYLATCVAAFKAGNINVMHLELEHA